MQLFCYDDNKWLASDLNKTDIFGEQGLDSAFGSTALDGYSYDPANGSFTFQMSRPERKFYLSVVVVDPGTAEELYR